MYEAPITLSNMSKVDEFVRVILPIPLTPEQNYGIDPNPNQKETGVGYEEVSITDII